MPEFSVKRIDGGLNLFIPPQGLPPPIWPVAQHFQFQLGRVELAPGWQSYSATDIVVTETPWLLYEFLMRDGTRHLICITDLNAYRYNSGTDAWIDLNITISAGPGTVWCTATNNILYFGSRDSGVFKWTGTGDATVVASSPKGAFGCMFADRLVVANMNVGGTLYPERVSWTMEGNPESYDADDYIELREVQGPITGMEPLTGKVLGAHKENGLWRIPEVGGADEFVSEYVPDVQGSRAGRSLCRGPGGVHFYVSRSGVHLWDGTAAPIEIGEPIFDSAAYRGSFAESIQWVYYDVVGDLMWWCIGWPGLNTGYDSEQAFVYDPRRNVWSQRRLRGTCAALHVLDADQGTTWDNTVGTWDVQNYIWDKLGQGDFMFTMIAGRKGALGGGSGAPHVDLYGANWDWDGTEMTGLLHTPVMSLDRENPDLDRLKRVSEVEVFTDSKDPDTGYVTLAVYAGDSPKDLVWVGGTPTNPAERVSRRVYLNATGRWWQLRISAQMKGNPVVITGYRIKYKLAGRQ
jgi:hypothetical protein